MKKLFAIVLALAMLLSLCACGAAPAEPTPDLNAPAAPDEGPSPVEIPALDADAGEEEAPVEDAPVEEAPAEAVPAGLTLGEVLKKDFLARAEAEPAITTLGMAEALMTNEVIQFGPVTMEMEPGLLNGFGNEEITGFAEAAIFAPMIGSIPFIGYIFRVEEGADAQDFADMLEENANLSWNICTTADEMVTAVSGSLVFFVMCPTVLEG